MSAPEVRAVDVERPVVICGVGRSGTSLLQSMLNAHPELCFPPETHVFRRYVANAAARRRYESLGPLALQAALQADADFARAGIEAGDFVTHVDGESVLGLTLDEAVDLMRGLRLPMRRLRLGPGLMLRQRLIGGSTGLRPCLAAMLPLIMPAQGQTADTTGREAQQ